jgi:hypothetical protein
MRCGPPEPTTGGHRRPRPDLRPRRPRRAHGGRRARDRGGARRGPARRPQPPSPRAILGGRGQPTGHSDGHRDRRRPPGARDHRPQRGRQDGGAQDLGLLALMAQSGCHVPARDGARLPVPSVFAIVATSRAWPRTSTFSAFAAARESSSALPTPDDGARWPGGAGTGCARAASRPPPTRAAQGLRLHASPGSQRLGGVRSGAARPHVPARLRSPGPELCPVHRRPPGPARRADRAGARVSLHPAAAAPGAAGPPRRPRSQGRGARRAARATRGGERVCSRGPRPSRGGGGERDGGPGQGGSAAPRHRGAPARERGVGPAQARREEPAGWNARASDW